MVLSHELATAAEMEPYLQDVLRPLRPLVLYCRAAGLEPNCHKQEAVSYGWSDPKGPSLCPSLAAALSAPCLTCTMGSGRSYT